MKSLISISLLALFLTFHSVTGNDLPIQNSEKSYSSEIIETDSVAHKYFTRDNITLGIALFGAFGTIGNWVISFIHSRKNISIKIIKNFRSQKYIVFYITIQNHSRLPISINDISIIIDGKEYTGFSVPVHTLRYQNYSRDFSIDREHTTIPFPVNLGSLAGASGYIRFDVSEEVSKTLSTHLIFRVSTNRGNSLQMKLERAEWVDWKTML